MSQVSKGIDAASHLVILLTILTVVQERFHLEDFPNHHPLDQRPSSGIGDCDDYGDYDSK